MPPHAASLSPPPSLAAEGRRLLQQAQERVLRMLDACAPLRDILLHLATTAESLSDGRTVASILVLDKDGLLRNGASPNLPADFLDAIDRLKPDPEVGTCAAAAATGQVVITRTFLDDNRWAKLRHLPLALGFVGAWSMPIKSHEGRVLGTFGTYFREPREPTDEEREVIHFLALVAAIAIGAHAAMTAYAA